MNIEKRYFLLFSQWASAPGYTFPLFINCFESLIWFITKKTQEEEISQGISDKQPLNNNFYQCLNKHERIVLNHSTY